MWFYGSSESAVICLGGAALYSFTLTTNPNNVKREGHYVIYLAGDILGPDLTHSILRVVTIRWLAWIGEGGSSLKWSDIKLPPTAEKVLWKKVWKLVCRPKGERLEELLAVVKTPRLLSFHPSPLISPQPAQLSNNRLGLQMDTRDQTRPDQAGCSGVAFPKIRFCENAFFCNCPFSSIPENSCSPFNWYGLEWRWQISVWKSEEK